MKLVNNILYIGFPDLIGYGFTETYLRKVTSESRKNGKKSYRSIPDPTDNRKCLIAYDSIPEETRTLKGLPLKSDLLLEISRKQLSNIINKDTKALDYFISQGGPSYEQADQLQEIAAWLMATAPIKKTSAKAMGYESVDEFYQDVMKAMSDKERGLSAWTISNLDRFKRKRSPFYKYFKAFPNHFDPDHSDYHIKLNQLPAEYEAALGSLISNKTGNQNAAKLKNRSDDSRAKRQADEMQAYLVMLMANNTPKLSLTQVYMAYMRKAETKFKEWQLEEQKGVGETMLRA